jgi:hypothetical protein
MELNLSLHVGPDLVRGLASAHRGQKSGMSDKPWITALGN